MIGKTGKGAPAAGLLLAAVLASLAIAPLAHAADSGLFAPPSLLGGEHAPRALAVADLDGDGLRDIAAAHNLGLSLFRNQSPAPGVVAFGGAQQQTTNGVDDDSDPPYDPPWWGPRLVDLTAADLDRDGLTDLVGMVNKRGKLVDALRNTSSPGSLSFDDPQYFGAVNSPGDSQWEQTARSSFIAAANLNPDDRPDLAVSAPSKNRVYLMEGTGDPGTIDFRPCPLPESAEKRCDTDDPNDPLGDPISWRNDALYNDRLSVADPKGVAAADLDGDGLDDLLVGSDDKDIPGPGPNIYVLPNRSKLPYPDRQPVFDLLRQFVPAPAGQIVVDSDDLNGDGRPDLVALRPADDAVAVYRNNGVSVEPPGGDVQDFEYRGFDDPVAAQTQTGGFPIAVAIGDLNEDDRPDLAVANFLGGTVSVLLNESSSESVHFSYGPTLDAAAVDVEISDLDKDGDGELVVSLPTKDAVAVFENLAHTPQSWPAEPGPCESCGTSAKQRPPRPSVSIKFTKSGGLRLTVKAGAGASLSKVSAALARLLKPAAYETRRGRSGLPRKLKGLAPKSARLKVGGNGTVTVRPRDSAKGAGRISFEVPARYLRREGICGRRSRVRVTARYTDGTAYRLSRRSKPLRSVCGARGRG